MVSSFPSLPDGLNQPTAEDMLKGSIVGEPVRKKKKVRLRTSAYKTQGKRGDGGIRTLEGLSTPTALAGRRTRPLCDISWTTALPPAARCTSSSAIDYPTNHPSVQRTPCLTYFERITWPTRLTDSAHKALWMPHRAMSTSALSASALSWTDK